jgi:hypothetical protein
VNRQREDWLRFIEDHPEFRENVVDVDDVQPSREEVLKGEVNSPSALEGGGFRFGVYQLVGHGKQTNHWCGSFGKFLACSRVELHNKMMFDAKTGSLVNFAGKADVHPVFRSCDKPSCPVCYERGWAVREADNVTFRLGEASKRLDHVAFGDPEHIIISVDPRYYGWSEEHIRKYVLKGLKNRGVDGGCLIPHWARFKRGLGWYLGIHYHVLGFIRHGFRKCRGCSHVNEKGSRDCCKGCSGFYGVSKKCWKKDRLIVEVKGKRESVFGTAWYQLHHATFDVSKKRHGIVKWFGICSYRRMKIPKEARKEYDKKRKPKCRICGSLLVRHEYRGHDLNILAWFSKRRGAREKVEWFFGLASDFVERPEIKKWGSGSYGR